MLNIPADDRDKIMQYLNENECSTANLGYTVLIYAIYIALKNPDYNCQDIFYEYAKNFDMKKAGITVDDKAEGILLMKNAWKKPYKEASYVVKNSKMKKIGVFQFIKNYTVRISPDF